MNAPFSFVPFFILWEIVDSSWPTGNVDRGFDRFACRPRKGVFTTGKYAYNEVMVPVVKDIVGEMVGRLVEEFHPSKIYLFESTPGGAHRPTATST